MSIKRPSPSLILIASFSPYNDLYILTGSNLNYTNQEIAKISYLDKETSVNAAIIVAYEKAALINSEISIQYDLKTLVYGKAEYLDFYDEINFGDEFVKLIGDNQTVVTDIADIATYTADSDAYEWFFLDESGNEYSLILSKDEVENKFGVTLKQYYLVDQENTYPKYKEASSNIGGPSGGLLQTLSIYNMLISDDLTDGRKIAGTGTINYDGSVGYIGGVEQKVLTAYLNGVDLFFMPSLDEDYYYDNYQEALRACETHNINPDGWLIPVSTFQEAIDYLEGE
jgi:PDZ domain-containing protein